MPNIHTGWLTLNRKCQFHCSWCYANTAKKHKDMDFVKALEAVDALVDLGAKKIILIGGEPLLYPDITELIAYIHSKNVIVSMATNGVELKDMVNCQNIKNAGIDNINISLKAVSEEGYETNVGVYGLNHALTAFQNLKNWIETNNILCHHP